MTACPGSAGCLPSPRGTRGRARCSSPATVWFEGGDEGLPSPPAPSRHEVRRVLRLDSGSHLVAQVKADLPGLLKSHPDAYVWIACDTTTTRALSSYVRKDLGVAKERVNALGYWREQSAGSR